MKSLLKKTKNSEIDFLLQGSLYESLYAKIEEVLSAEEASVFCRIERRKSECIWYGEEDVQYQPLVGLSEDEKFNLSDLLAEKKAAIMPKLKADPVLAPHAESLFRVPSEGDIYQIRKPDGTTGVAISRWAIKLALASDDADPIVKLINIPKPDHFPVTIAVQYSDGAPYAKEPFFFSYQDNAIKSFKTDEKGIFQLGRLKKGRTFGIRQFEEDVEHTFTVESEQSIYPVVFPRYVTFEVQVLNQEDTPMPQQVIHLLHGNEEQVFQTNEEGTFTVASQLLNNEPIELRTSDGAFSQTYELSIETERLIFRLKEKMYGEITLLVKDQHGESYDSYPIKVRGGEEELNYETNAEGKVELGAVEYETLLEFIDGRDQYNKLSHTVEKGLQEVIFEVERPVIPPVKVQLLNHKKKTISGHPPRF
jgi:hypothetical protein